MGALALYALLVRHFDFVADDAFISFRYARHLAEGRGLVFNPGESPPVEGYSNLLWVLWLAPFERAGVDVVLAARLTAVACGAALLLVLARACRELSGAARTSGLLVLASFPPLAVWTAGGLETVPFTLACFALFVLLSGDPGRGRALAAATAGLTAALLRADGVLWVAAAVAAAGLGAGARPRAWLRMAALACGLIAAGVAAHVAWRAGYHGDWLPNTARLKADPSWLRLERGARYLASHALELPALVLAPLLAAAARGGGRPRLALQAGLLLAFTAAHTLWVGGDFMAMGRFLVPAAPFVALLWALAVEGALSLPRGGRIAAAGTGALLASALLATAGRMPVPDHWRQALHFRWSEARATSEAAAWREMRSRAREWIRTGRALARIEQPGEAIVLANIGAIGYHTRLTIHDLCGLVSPEVARAAAGASRASAGHDKRVESGFFLPRRPTFLAAWIDEAAAPAAEPAQGAPLRLERHPLPAEAGFPPGHELRLLRFQWGD